MKIERVSINHDFRQIEEFKKDVKKDNKLKDMLADKTFDFAKENFLNKKGEPKWFLRFNIIAWAQIGWEAIKLFIRIFEQIKKDRGKIGSNIAKTELDNM